MLLASNKKIVYFETRNKYFKNIFSLELDYCRYLVKKLRYFINQHKDLGNGINSTFHFIL